MSTERIGILLINSGTPHAADAGAVRAFLARFLADPRVVELPRALWLPLLYSVVLPFRPRRVARKYRRIWSAAGSPLRDGARPRMAAAVADACDLPRDAALLLSLFFAVTKSKYVNQIIFGYKSRFIKSAGI